MKLLGDVDTFVLLLESLDTTNRMATLRRGMTSVSYYFVDFHIFSYYLFIRFFMIMEIY